MNLIIGGSGFVGSFLLKELKNHKFINLDKNPSPFFNNNPMIPPTTIANTFTITPSIYITSIRNNYTPILE